MTQSLEKAILEIKKLPDEEQDAIAAVIMAELKSEQQWDNAFENSRAELDQLAEEALKEYSDNETEPLDQNRYDLSDHEAISRGTPRFAARRPRPSQISLSTIFQADPYHPSLRFKKVHPTKPIFAVRISRDYRALGVRRNDSMIWFWIGSHAEYDQLRKRL